MAVLSNIPYENDHSFPKPNQTILLAHVIRNTIINTTAEGDTTYP